MMMETFGGSNALSIREWGEGNIAASTVGKNASEGRTKEGD